jgi:hypothetical protein
MKYVKNILIALDQLVNTIFLGDPDETISSRAGKRVNTCKFCSALCWLLDKIDKDHCKTSLENDEGQKEIK